MNSLEITRALRRTEELHERAAYILERMRRRVDTYADSRRPTQRHMAKRMTVLLITEYQNLITQITESHVHAL